MPGCVRLKMPALPQQTSASDTLVSVTPGTDESSALGCVLALEAHHLAGKMPLVGFDTDPDLVRALRQHVLDALIVQDPYKIGYDAVRALVRKLHGQSSPARIQTPLHLVTPANMNAAGMQAVLAPPVFQ